MGSSKKNDGKLHLVLRNDDKGKFYIGSKLFKSISHQKHAQKNYTFFYEDSEKIARRIQEKFKELQKFPWEQILPVDEKYEGKCSIKEILHSLEKDSSCKSLECHKKTDVKLEQDNPETEMHLEKEQDNETIAPASPELVVSIYSYKGVFQFAVVGSFMEVSELYEEQKVKVSDLIQLIEYLREKFQELSRDNKKVTPLYQLILDKKDEPRDCIIRKYDDISKKSMVGVQATHYILFSNYWKAQMLMETKREEQCFYIRANHSLDWKICEKKHFLERILFEPSFKEQNEVKILSTENSKQFEKQLDELHNAIQEKKDDVYHIYVDGSCNHTKNMYSWAFVVYLNEQEIFFDKGHEERLDLMSHGSQVGEFLAMIHAVEYILENNLKNVVVWYDNFLNFNCMSFLSTNNKTDIFDKYFSYMQQKKKIFQAKQINVFYEHARSHSGIRGNERADYLAKKAITEVNTIF